MSVSILLKKTRSGDTDTDTFRGQGHAQGTRTCPVDSDTMRRHRQPPWDTVTVTARCGHGTVTVETRKSCKLGIITVDVFP